MLHKEAVSRTTLEFLKTLMRDPALDRFVLVGGTALSLQIGHRVSIDFDLFTTDDFDQMSLNQTLQIAYGFRSDYMERNTLKGVARGIALDFLSHKYETVEKTLEIEGIRMAGLREIAAMKLNAIIHNGTRVKDFVDVAFLGERLTFREMAKAYEQKYKTNVHMAAKALLYHNDINHSVAVELLPMAYDFEAIGRSLETLVKNPNETHLLQSRGNGHS